MTHIKNGQKCVGRQRTIVHVVVSLVCHADRWVTWYLLEVVSLGSVSGVCFVLWPQAAHTNPVFDALDF